jgi:hypothetical protein
LTLKFSDEVLVDDFTVIARSAVAIGFVARSEAKKRMARGGKLDVDHG